MWRISVIGPLIRSRLSRSSAGALMINVFKVIIACDLDLTALSRAILKCRIISHAPVCVLARAVACPFSTDRAALWASRLSDFP